MKEKQSDPNLAPQASTVKKGIVAGLISGSSQALAFHGFDIALYEGQTAIPPRPFFHPDNWTHPFHNLWQSVGQRTITSGSYFVFQGVFSPIKTFMTDKGYSKESANIALGVSAGAITGAINNPLTYTRYVSWGPDKLSFMASARHLHNAGGASIFTRGITPSILRDMVFGSIYELSRTRYRALLDAESHPFKKFGADMMGATTGILFASPFNYARNIIYRAPANEPAPSVSAVMKQLFFSPHTERSTSKELFQTMGRALQIGPATVRFACGMAFGQFVTDKVSALLEVKTQEGPKPPKPPRI